jgi:hypothetical protein
LLSSFKRVLFFSEKYLELLIVTLQNLAPDSLNIDSSIREMLEDSRNSFHKRHQDHKISSQGNVLVADEGHENLAAKLMHYWQYVMTFILLSFMTSCISQFAQHYQLGLDVEEISKLKTRLMLQQMIGDKVSGSASKMVRSIRTQHPFIHRSNSPFPDEWNHSAASPASPYSLMVPPNRELNGFSSPATTVATGMTTPFTKDGGDNDVFTPVRSKQ